MLTKTRTRLSELTPRLLGVVLFSYPLFAQECVPPCRAGYVCKDGQCVSICNPPCPPGSRCDPDLVDCVPIPQPASQSEPQVAPQPTPAVQDQEGVEEYRVEEPAVDHPVVRRADPRPSSQCGEDELMFYGQCESEWSIATAGAGVFWPSFTFYTLGTLYSAGAPIGWAFGGYYEESYYNGTSYYYESHYDGVTFAALAPQTAAFVFGGGINQAAKLRQRRYLNELGSSGGGGLVAAGWVMYGASILTATLNITSYISDNQQFAVTTAFINAAVLVSSYVINTVGYGVGRVQLREAVSARKVRGRSERHTPEVLPYVGLGKEKTAGGLAVRF